VEELFARRRKLRLTRAALETVAIIAYRQPVTKTDIEHIRGVNSDGVLHNLMEKNMITIVGRAESVGKPLQYGTTDEFLKFFGLNQLTDLPKMSEIEELIRASDEQKQTELILEEREDGSIKLNIADGTFDPASRNRDDEAEDDAPDVTGEEERSQAGPEDERQEQPTEDEAAAESGETTLADSDGSDDKPMAGRLVLKQSTPDERRSEDSAAEDHEQEVTVDDTGEAEADR
jgi:segregation and condensation protein B